MPKKFVTVTSYASIRLVYTNNYRGEERRVQALEMVCVRLVSSRRSCFTLSRASPTPVTVSFALRALGEKLNAERLPSPQPSNSLHRRCNYLAARKGQHQPLTSAPSSCWIMRNRGESSHICAASCSGSTRATRVRSVSDVDAPTNCPQLWTSQTRLPPSTC